MAALFAACSSGEEGEQPIRIGVADIDQPHWEVFKTKAAEEGIPVELVGFSDYTTPNPALDEGSIELNQFQHVRYLANYNATSDGDLTVIGATYIPKLQLYSTRWDEPAQIPEGGTVVLSNNPANHVRPLLLLEKLGLVSLRGGASWDSTLDDVIAEESRVQLKQIEPSLIPQTLSSVDAAFVDDAWATKAGITDEDVIAIDDPQGPAYLQYVNIFAARSEDQDNETYRRLVEIFHLPEVQAPFAKSYPDSAERTDSVEDLRAELARLEEEFA